MSYYSNDELAGFAFKKIGDNVKISTKCSIYNAGNISIESNVRIDDFAILSAGCGGIEIGSYVHIGAYSSLIGEDVIRMEDFSGLSSRVSVYSSNDDYLGVALTNPTVPLQYRKVKSKPIYFGRHAIVGANSVILPGAYLPEGVSVGCMSVVNKKLDEWTVYSGNPVIVLGRRSKKLLFKECKLLEE